jgi:hypothetical protein
MESEMAAEAEAEEVGAPPDLPTKVESETITVTLRARVLQFDFDGRSGDCSAAAAAAIAIASAIPVAGKLQRVVLGGKAAQEGGCCRFGAARA